jgi:hypothetical protein
MGVVARSRQPAQQNYRSMSTRWVAGLFVFIGVLVTIGGIGAVAAPPKGGSSLAGIIGILVGVLVVAWAVGVVARMGVTTGDVRGEKGCIVQNWVRRRFVRWDELSGFSFGSDIENLSVREMFSTPMLSTYAVLKNGQRLSLSGLSATRMNRSKSRAKVQILLDRLDAQRLHFAGG